eukprot:m51a1_g2006 hypothetical protein (245) ;mRNA; r:1245235-1246051
MAVRRDSADALRRFATFSITGAWLFAAIGAALPPSSPAADTLFLLSSLTALLVSGRDLRSLVLPLLSWPGTAVPSVLSALSAAALTLLAGLCAWSLSAGPLTPASLLPALAASPLLWALEELPFRSCALPLAQGALGSRVSSAALVAACAAACRAAVLVCSGAATGAAAVASVAAAVLVGLVEAYWLWVSPRGSLAPALAFSSACAALRAAVPAGVVFEAALALVAAPMAAAAALAAQKLARVK